MPNLETICKCAGWFVLCVVLFLPVSGCDNNHPDTVKIGFIGCLTGKCSDLGTAGRDGVLLAVDEINQAGGFLTSNNKRKRIEIISASTRTSEGVSAAEENFRNIVAQDVLAVIGPMTSQVGVLLKPEADAAQVVLLSPTVSTTQLSGMDDYFFRLYPTCDLTAPALATYATQIDGMKKVAIAYDEINVAFVDPWIEFFRKTIVDGGGQIVGLQPLSDARPMLKSAERVHGMQPDGVLVIANAYQTGLFIQQLEKLGSTAHVFGTEWSTAKGLEAYAGRALEGSSFISSFDQESQSEMSLKFQSAYLERFNQEPTFAAKFGYEALRLLVAGLAKTSPDVSLKEALKTLGPVAGLQSDLVLDQFGDIDRTVYVKQFNNGSFKTVAKYIHKTIVPNPAQ